MKTPEKLDDFLASYGITLDLYVHKSPTTRVMLQAEKAYMAAGREIVRQIRAQEKLAKALK